MKVNELVTMIREFVPVEESEKMLEQLQYMIAVCNDYGADDFYTLKAEIDNIVFARQMIAEGKRNGNC